jgi:hypothetical protein
MTAVWIAVLIAAIVGYGTFWAVYLLKYKDCSKVLRSLDAEEVMADIIEKRRFFFRFYTALIVVPTPDGEKKEKHIYTRNYIDNYRPMQLPIVYSKRLGRTATKGRHELRVFQNNFLPFGIALVVIAAACVFLITN